jgi:ribonuclease HII
MLLAGIEEAGRGPVIGPLVMCGIAIDADDEYRLKSIGAKDSKLLTPRTREILFDQIVGMVKACKVFLISPQEIDDAVGSENTNLNWLEAEKSAELINLLKPDKAILDCPSNNPKAYVQHIRKFLKHECQIIAEHKADVHYPVVSAASIIAKVTRDREIEKLKKQIGIDFGSGYPADDVTRKFLHEHHESHASLFRKTWSTYRALAEKKGQKSLGEF